MKNLLITLGDALYSTDQVAERNEIGFNAYDYGAWAGARGDVLKMQSILKKYKRQIESRFGEKAYKDAGLDKPLPSCATVFIGKNKFGNICARLSGNTKNFYPYINYHKENGFYGGKDDDGFYWEFPNISTFDFNKYTNDMLKLNILVAQNFNELINKEKEKVIAEQKRKESIKDTVFFDCEPDGKFSIKYEYSYELNQLVSNKNSSVSGIVEYRSSDHARLTYELELIEEIISKIPEKFKIVKSDAFVKGSENYKLKKEENQRPTKEMINLMTKGIEFRPYQNEGIRFLNSLNGTGLILDQMGLGKTPQALGYLASNNKTGLIICPKTVRRNWIKEAVKFFDKYYNENNVVEITSKNFKKYNELVKNKKLVSVNYQIFKKIVKENLIVDGSFDAIVIDESHRIKNPKSQITQAALKVSKLFKHRICLSGTSVKNKREEIKTQVDFVDENFFKNRSLKNMTIGGTWNLMKKISIARRKNDVLKDLPPKIVQSMEVEVKDMPSMKGGVSFEEVTRFKIAAAKAKVEATVEVIEEFLESSESAILVGSESIDVAEAIAKALGREAILHNGQMSDDARENAKDRFQNDGAGPRVFVTTRQSLEAGATLTRADIVVVNDWPWSAADLDQFIDRTHRFGQKNAVNAYIVCAQGSEWDNKLANLIIKKLDLCRRVNQGQKLTPEELKLLKMDDAIDE